MTAARSDPATKRRPASDGGHAFRSGPCLITGGAGFIGSHLAEYLVARGRRIIIVDDLSTGRRDNLAGVDPEQYTFIEGRVCDVLPDLNPGDYAAVYHLAASVGVRLVIEQPIHTIETNVLETSALLRFASAARVPTLLASTSEVYGKSTRTPFVEDDDVVYGPTIYSRWSYACSKSIDEYLALAHHREHSLPVVIARFFNTVGPRQVGDYGMVIPRFVERALANQPIEVHGDGEQTRCFCDVRDVVPVIVRLIEWAGEGGSRTGERHRNAGAGGQSEPPPVFNLGRDEPISINELANLVKETLQSDSEIVHVPYDEAFGRGFDDLRTRQPDLTRLRKTVGFSPSIPLAQTIRDLAQHMTRPPRSSTPAHTP